jgi:hypothetical protein
LIFGGRRLRRAACAGIVLLQLLIGGSGNYTFFNLLTVALALLLLDDAVWRRVLPAWVLRLAEPEHAGPRSPRPTGLLTLVAGLSLLILSAATLWTTLATSSRLPGLLAAPLELLQPLRSVNQYGLFRVMTTTRAEIVVEGSDDGETWMVYQFKYKPGEVTRAPALVEPHQPRLDWQMWFAALGDVRGNPWFVNFCFRLLQGQPDVLVLVQKHPFPDRPPKFIRARTYDYHFTTLDERRQDGAWWRREYKAEYCPPLSLENFSRQ